MAFNIKEICSVLNQKNIDKTYKHTPFEIKSTKFVYCNTVSLYKYYLAYHQPIVLCIYICMFVTGQTAKFI